MTNHLNYPYHRRKDKDSIIITFKDGHIKYSSCDFNKSQVTYLCTSHYLENATLIEYSHHKMTPNEFYFGYGYVAIEYLESLINDLKNKIDLVNQRKEISRVEEFKQTIELMKLQNKKGESK